MNSDLEYAKSSLQELFYVLDLNMEADKVKALAEVADIITAIPARVETLYERATQEGYQVNNRRWWQYFYWKISFLGLCAPQLLGQLEAESPGDQKIEEESKACWH